MKRREINLARRAIKERWAIPAQARKELAAKLWDVVLTTTDVRAKVAAARVLLEMDRVQMEQEKRDLEIPDRHEVTGKGGGPIQAVDPSRLTDEQLAQLEAIAKASRGEGTSPAD